MSLRSLFSSCHIKSRWLLLPALCIMVEIHAIVFQLACAVRLNEMCQRTFESTNGLLRLETAVQHMSTWPLEGLEGGSALLRTQQHWPPRPEKRIYWWNWNTRRNWTAESLKSSWEKKGGWIFCSDTQELWRSTPSPSTLFWICFCHCVLLFDHSHCCSNVVNCFAYLFPTFNVRASVLIYSVN